MFDIHSLPTRSRTECASVSGGYKNQIATMLRQRHCETRFGQERPRGIEMRDERTGIDGGHRVVRTIVTNTEADGR